MGFFGKPRTTGQKLDRRRSLAGVPVLNANVSLDESAEQALVLSVKVPRGNGFLDRFRPAVMSRQVKLDELGSFVLRQISGTATVADIVDAFVAKYQINRREAELCVVEFLKALAERRAISIVIE